MLKEWSIFIIGLITSYSCAQVPGGLSVEPKIWLKANAGTNAITTGTNISQWANQTSVNFSLTQPLIFQQPVYNENNSNYNPSVYFDGNNDKIGATLGANSFNAEFTYLSVTKLMSLTPEGAIFHNHTTPTGNSDLTSFQLDANGVSYRYRNNFNILGQDGIQIAPYNSEYRLFSILNQNNGVNTIVNTFERGAPANSGTFNGNNRGQVFQDCVLGTNRVGSTYSQNFSAEFIVFPYNLTEPDRRKVETYLAVKYGFTLDNNPGGLSGDYVATNDVLLWDASNSILYHNDIIGIGRDDAEALNQKQSHTKGDNLRLYIDALATSNANNMGVIANDVAYILIGNNQDNICSNSLSSNEMPLPLTARIQREWKVYNTNFNQEFNLDIDLSICALADVPLETELRLLVDDDGDFSNAQVFSEQDGIDFILTATGLTIKNISTAIIPMNTAKHMSVGIIKPTVLIQPFIQPICVGDSAAMIIDAPGAMSPFNMTFTDGTNVFTIANINSGDSIYVAPAMTTNYSVIIDGVYGCCGYDIIGSNVQLVVIPAFSIITTQDTTICENGSANIWASTNGPNTYNYFWDVYWANDSSFLFYPINDTIIHVWAEDQYGCISDTGEILVQLFPSLSGNINPNTSICPGEEIALVSDVSGGIGPYDFSWSNGELNNDPFSDEIVVNPAQNTTYYVVVSDECESTPLLLETTVSVVDIPQPTFDILNYQDCEPAHFELANTTQSATPNSVSWIINGWYFLNEDSIIIESLYAGDYDVEMIILTQEGCVDSIVYVDALHVNPSPIASFIFSPNQPTIFSTEVFFDNGSIGADNYEWYFESGSPAMSNLTDPTTLFPEGVAGTYEVILYAITDKGCIDSTSQIIEVHPDINIYAPNAFTPDGNEFNQGWRVFMDGIDIYGFELFIYNRWGEIIWKSHDIEQEWDGTYNGRLVPTGTYIWNIKAEDLLNGAVYRFDGHVNVLR